MSTNNDVIINEHTFELLSPSRFITFTFPNPNPNPNPHPLLRIAVLDSPLSSSSHPSASAAAAAAGMLVPAGREHDWIFSTESGHLHLLLSSSPPLCRLILIGNLPPSPQPEPATPYARSASDPDPLQTQTQTLLLPLLLALCPKSSAVPDVPFLSYADDVTRINPVDHLVGPAAGEMLVEDVEIGGEFRRRLRFKRMPNLVQSQVRISETGSLLQPYLGPMVAGLSLSGSGPGPGPNARALCLGVGGGALLMCLRCHFGFSVVGVEADEVVLGVAKRHFGLVEDELLRVVVGDGIELLMSRNGVVFDESFDVIMVDFDSGDVWNGICVPPLEFVDERVLLGARRALRENGIVVVNVIPPDGSFYRRLIDSLSGVFDELYEIEVGNGENYVLVAAASPVGLVGRGNKGLFYEKLKQVGVERFVDCIRKI